MRDTRFVRVALLAVAGIAAALGGACATDSAADAGTADTPSDVNYPVAVVDLLGREVIIEGMPETIVTLSPTAAEFVAAMGAPVAGRSSTTRYPPEVEGAVDIGQAYQPNVETILSLGPDLIVADGFVQGGPQLREVLEGLGVPVVFVSANSLEETTTSYQLLGQVFGRAALASERAAEVDAARASAAQSVPDGLSAIVLIADRDGSLYAAGSDSWAGALLAAVGVENPAAAQPDSGRYPGFVLVPMEMLLSWDPDYVLAVTPAPFPAPRLTAVMRMMPPMRGLTAMSEGRVVEMDVELMLQAPGPRVVEALNLLGETLAAEE